MTELAGPKQRIQSIDLLRGIVIVIMALDHVRDFFHIEGASDVPTNLATTTPVLFLTRWITHFCAPVFVFLAGTSAFLQGMRKPKKELSLFLIKRGLWLVLMELVIVTLGITFDPTYHIFIMQVIWAIGISMIILGLLIRFPFPVILIYGLLIVFFHNLADTPEKMNNGPVGFWWNLVHGRFYFASFGGNRGLLVVYAFLPWSGVMALGYCFGKLFHRDADAAWRKKALIYIGSGLIILFFILRGFNNYGDPFPWTEQSRGGIYTFISFFNANKYPPSLVYLCMTLGPAILFLAFIEHIKNRVTGFFITYGRVPFFFYILHFYLIHILCVIAFYANGFGNGDIISPGSPFLFRPLDFGYSLWVVYLIWIAVVLSLYPLCKKYDKFKSTQRKWWTSYV
ncbi:MAG TPA: heparan-alpha-glucosaminide N-acetyltransferase domain-containing protein [Chitinophagaceae bacterium]